jgi:hypothetical protein
MRCCDGARFARQTVLQFAAFLLFLTLVAGQSNIASPEASALKSEWSADVTELLEKYQAELK